MEKQKPCETENTFSNFPGEMCPSCECFDSDGEFTTCRKIYGGDNNEG